MGLRRGSNAVADLSLSALFPLPRLFRVTIPFCLICNSPLPRNGCLTVYDVSSRHTFDELLKWFKEIDMYCGEGVVKMVVGNKVDKVGDCCRNLVVKLDGRLDGPFPYRGSGHAVIRNQLCCASDAAPCQPRSGS